MFSLFAFGFPGIPELFILVILALVFVWPVCRIVGKAGFPPLLGLFVLIPVGNFLLLLFLAFADWPALRGSQGRHDAS